MDTSEIYIKMCQKAVEIQAVRLVGKPYEAGDWCKPQDYHGFELTVSLESLKPGWELNPSNSAPYTYTYQVGMVERLTGWDDSINYDMPEREPSDIWLPLQDQLQEMLGTFAQQKQTMREYLARESLNDVFPGLSFSPADSMEQLWLAFVMKEKYHKAWNGEDWVLQINNPDFKESRNGEDWV